MQCGLDLNRKREFSMRRMSKSCRFSLMIMIMNLDGDGGDGGVGDGGSGWVTLGQCP